MLSITHRPWTQQRNYLCCHFSVPAWKLALTTQAVARIILAICIGFIHATALRRARFWVGSTSGFIHISSDSFVQMQHFVSYAFLFWLFKPEPAADIIDINCMLASNTCVRKKQPFLTWSIKQQVQLLNLCLLFAQCGMAHNTSQHIRKTLYSGTTLTNDVDCMPSTLA